MVCDVDEVGVVVVVNLACLWDYFVGETLKAQRFEPFILEEEEGRSLGGRSTWLSPMEILVEGGLDDWSSTGVTREEPFSVVDASIGEGLVLFKGEEAVVGFLDDPDGELEAKPVVVGDEP